MMQMIFFSVSITKKLNEDWLEVLNNRFANLQDGKHDEMNVTPPLVSTVSVGFANPIEMETQTPNSWLNPDVTISSNRDAGIQTDSIEDLEGILRLLHQKPELIKPVKAYVRAVDP